MGINDSLREKFFCCRLCQNDCPSVFNSFSSLNYGLLLLTSFLCLSLVALIIRALRRTLMQIAKLLIPVGGYEFCIAADVSALCQCRFGFDGGLGCYDLFRHTSSV